MEIRFFCPAAKGRFTVKMRLALLELRQTGSCISELESTSSATVMFNDNSCKLHELTFVSCFTLWARSVTQAATEQELGTLYLRFRDDSFVQLLDQRSVVVGLLLPRLDDRGDILQVQPHDPQQLQLEVDLPLKEPASSDRRVDCLLSLSEALHRTDGNRSKSKMLKIPFEVFSRLLS